LVVGRAYSHRIPLDPTLDVVPEIQLSEMDSW
jgi:hypothetical protein